MRLLQFTDPHLPGSPGCWFGVSPTTRLRALRRARAAAPPAARAVLLTGDLVHDDAGGYAAPARAVRRRGAPVHCLPGNHDDPAVVKRGARRSALRARIRARYGAWMVVMMDSTVAGPTMALRRGGARAARRRARGGGRARSSACTTTRFRTAALARRADARQRRRVLRRARAASGRTRPRLGPHAPAVRRHARAHPPDGHALDLHAVRAERGRVRGGRAPARLSLARARRRRRHRDRQSNGWTNMPEGKVHVFAGALRVRRRLRARGPSPHYGR